MRAQFSEMFQLSDGFQTVSRRSAESLLRYVQTPYIGRGEAY